MSALLGYPTPTIAAVIVVGAVALFVIVTFWTERH